MTTPTKRERRDAARQARVEAEHAAAQRAERKRRLTLFGGIVAVAAVVVALVAALSGGSSSSGSAAAADGEVAGAADVSAMLEGIPQDGATLGDPNAPITLVEFGDLQCPFCKTAAEQVIPQVVRDEVRAGRVKIEFRDMAFLGEDSTRLARAAAGAAQQGRYWSAIELLYRNQGTENSGYATDAYLRSVLGAIPGLDVDRALRDADSAAATELLEDATSLARRTGVASTPTFFVAREGGELQPVEGADLTAVKAAIDELQR